MSRLPASDVPEEKPFYDTLLVLFDQWKDRVWDADTFTLEMTTALAPLCTGIANGVLDQELAHPHIAGMGIPDFWREVTAQPMLDMVPAFLEQYLSMLVETTERAQEKKPDTWQVWAFGNTRADTLATDIVTATQAMTMMMFTGVYNAVMASPALDEE